MSDFPIELIHPLAGTLRGEPGDVSINIPLRPFSLDREKVDTAIRLDGVHLPTCHVETLIEQSFDFPLNPEDGYIDSSVYIDHAHHPIDVSRISFTSKSGKHILMRLELKLILTQEGLGSYSDVSTTLEVPVPT